LNCQLDFPWEGISVAHSFVNPAAFHTWLERLRVNDPETFRQFAEDYGPYMMGVIRRSLHADTRLFEVTLDVLQRAYLKLALGALMDYDFDCPEDLKAFLTRLAEFEARQANRRAQGR